MSMEQHKLDVLEKSRYTRFTEMMGVFERNGECYGESVFGGR